ncbi:MAG: hypothetical protein AB7P52_17635 [Alphaproteobacteria bacterium]
MLSHDLNALVDTVERALQGEGDLLIERDGALALAAYLRGCADQAAAMERQVVPAGARLQPAPHGEGHDNVVHIHFDPASRPATAGGGVSRDGPA